MDALALVLAVAAMIMFVFAASGRELRRFNEIALGLVFLTGQSLAWHQLALQHVFFKSNPSSHFFYLITYTHAIHLFLGIAALATTLIALKVSRSLETRQILVDCAAWYWHTMGLFWIFLFALLAFFQ